MAVRFGVLGPLVAQDARGPVELKGPRHRAVLARLLVARGRVVPAARLVDDLWEDPPDGAQAALQTFVSALRRALEPDRAPRAPARLLVTEGPGYALRAEPDAVDAWRFEDAVSATADLLAAGRADAALARVDEALALWRGPAYAEVDGFPWARAEIARLDELRLLAGERRAEALLALGRAAEAVPDLEGHTEAHPWREEGWRLFALALYRAGRQGDALAALRRARKVLADELGVDPGPALRGLEADVLAQAPRLTPTRPVPALVGRGEELDRLLDAAATAATRGRLGLVLLSGEAGAGKTALAEAAAARLSAQGWTTAWGGNPEHEGVPAGWAWTRILDTLEGPGPESEAGADPVTARFRWHRAVGAHLARTARQAPLLLVLDDVHWAGEETLALLAAVVTEPVPAPVLVVAAYRTTEVSPELAEFLGRVARTEPVRLYLGGLPQTAVPDLVRAATGLVVDEETAAVLHRRSAGNPFFLRELARLLDAEGTEGLAAVPPGVRDLVRYRAGKLPEDVGRTLRMAAVAGTRVDPDVLSAAAGQDVLDALETAMAQGFLTEELRFSHDLVRDALYQDVSPVRRARWHARIGEAIERLRPGDVEALAHHFLLAGSDRAAGYARAAAEQAEARFAPHEAVRLWRAALDAHDRSGSDDVRTRLELVMGLVRALPFTGELWQAGRYREEAVTLAERLGDPVFTARVIGAFDVPAIWTEHDDPALAARLAAVAERTLEALPPEETAARGRLLATLVLELRNTGGARANEAAREAEEIARRLDDPALLAFALNARFMRSFGTAGLAPERRRIGEELLELAIRHGMVTFEVLARLVLVQAHAALAGFAVADEHAAVADRLAADYRLPLVAPFTRWYRALRTAVAGEPAEAAYRDAAAGLAGTEMSGVDNGIGAFALLCHRISQGRLPEDGEFGGYTPWCRPLVLLGAGREDEARAALAAVPPSPRDLLYEARTCLHAVAAVELGGELSTLYEELLPAAAELAGAGSGMLTLRPVAHYLGDLATALGRPDEAAAHYRQAAAVAARAGAPHWAAAARAGYRPLS
ncbi:hypothetical protein GCM10023214_30450 [Amycolatopsis dongchuanensis]|uniref:OmpR/PhoB-type domain-containing protein n=1 Tax=Amycolatopsis dongchuanensis TaxID=1070866 RepID=A0ABP9QJM3_9PSEU